LPISSAVVAYGFVFVSGHVGWLPGTQQAAAGIEAQTVQTLEKLKAVLEAAGTSLANVVKVNVFLSNVNDFAAMNEVYRRYFPLDPPARTTVGAVLVSPDLLIEIEMVAMLDRQEM
jgi:2-iminobutanoate/2-iminopropanoate deaminase